MKARTLALDLGAAPHADITINYGAGDLIVAKPRWQGCRRNV
jgi:hypothetical protein